MAQIEYLHGKAQQHQASSTPYSACLAEHCPGSRNSCSVDSRKIGISQSRNSSLLVPSEAISENNVGVGRMRV